MTSAVMIYPSYELGTGGAPRLETDLGGRALLYLLSLREEPMDTLDPRGERWTVYAVSEATGAPVHMCYRSLSLLVDAGYIGKGAFKVRKSGDSGNPTSIWYSLTPLGRTAANLLKNAGVSI